MRTECHSMTNIFLFARNIQLPPVGTCSNNQHRSLVTFTTLNRQHFHFPDYLGFFYPAILKYINMVSSQMAFQVLCQFFTGSPRHGYQILNTHGLIHLTTYTFSHYSHPQPFSSRIYGSRSTGRTASRYQHIILFRFKRFRNRCTITHFKFFEQITDITASHMNLFAIGKHCRNSLHFHAVHLLFIHSTVYSFMAYLRIKHHHQIQCLNYIRTVGAAQR